jgi:hypothetical protein
MIRARQRRTSMMNRMGSVLGRLFPSLFFYLFLVLSRSQSRSRSRSPAFNPQLASYFPYLPMSTDLAALDGRFGCRSTVFLDDERDAKLPWRPRVGAGSSVPISDSSPSPQPLGCDPPRLQEGPRIPVFGLYVHDRQASTEKTQNVGVQSSYNHNCLSCKALLQRKNFAA